MLKIKKWASEWGAGPRAAFAKINNTRDEPALDPGPGTVTVWDGDQDTGHCSMLHHPSPSNTQLQCYAVTGQLQAHDPY